MLTRSSTLGAIMAPIRAIIEQAPIPVFRIDVGKSSLVYLVFLRKITITKLVIEIKEKLQINNSV